MKTLVCYECCNIRELGWEILLNIVPELDSTRCSSSEHWREKEKIPRRNEVNIEPAPLDHNMLLAHMNMKN
jgi:hypothetical protein